jgi:transketolase
MIISNLKRDIRKNIIEMAFLSQEGHVASSYSIVDILIAIFVFCENHYSREAFLKNFILSKGHAVFALYGLLSEFDLLDKKLLSEVCTNGSSLIGHVPVAPKKIFSLGTGSLGHGFPVSLGRAVANSHLGIDVPQFVIVGDGELNEGSCWETLLLMLKFPNNQLRVFLDNNSSSSRAINLTQIISNLHYNWDVLYLDGHNVEEMINYLEVNNSNKQNLLFVCKTEKGFPLKELINNPAWHHKSPNLEQKNEFLKELDTFYKE